MALYHFHVERGSADRGGLALVSVYSIRQTDDYSWQPRRGQNILCHAACSGLYQSKISAADGTL
jgi:hypothetical protein